MPSSPSPAAGSRKALLFGGWTDEGHFNEIEYLYRVFTGPRYQYDPGDVQVLNFDGTSNYNLIYTDPVRGRTWPGDGTPYQVRVDEPGSIEELEAVFDRWSNSQSAERLSPTDSVFLFFTGHGYHPREVTEESWLRCFPDPSYFSASQLGGLIAGLPPIRQLMVLAQPCHSGGLVQSILQNSTATATTVAASCAKLNMSLGGVPADPFSPFSKAWISAMNGLEVDGLTPLRGPNPDADGDGTISSREAFAYASPNATADAPVFDFKPAGADAMTLH